MVKNKNVPEIRFSGFRDEWEQRTLGEVIDDQYNGQTPSRANDSFWNGNINWLSSGELNRGIVFETVEKITEEGKRDANLKMISKGTFVMAITGLEAAGTRGNCAILGMDTTLNQSCMALFPNKNLLNSLFLFQWYRKVGEEYGLLYTQGTKQQSYNAKLIKILPIILPSVREQIQIADFFDKIDNTIAIQQNKISILNQTKKGLLQKMFPREGESVPELRFPGFTDDWELRKLDEIFNILDGDRGKNYPSDKDFLDNGATLFLDTGNVKKNGFNFTIKKFILKEKDEALRSGKLKLHDFILTSRGTLGNVAYYDEETLKNYPSVRINSAMLILRPILRNEVSDYYMTSVLRGNVIDNFMSKNRVGSAQPHITKRDFSKIEIRIPTTIGEQQQIGTFFKQLDNTIALHQRELDLLKETKKGFLQKLFV